MKCVDEAYVNTVGDTISMQVEPWFSHEVGKDFLKWENGGERYYQTKANKASLVEPEWDREM